MINTDVFYENNFAKNNLRDFFVSYNGYIQFMENTFI